MNLHIEVPEGMKFCRCCGGVFPKATGFYQQKKLIKATNEVKTYPHTLCKKCTDARVAILRKTMARAATATPQASLPAVASEIIDAAWNEAQVVFRRAGKLHWRPSHRAIPAGAELIGAYDKGARFDCVLADLSL